MSPPSVAIDKSPRSSMRPSAPSFVPVPGPVEEWERGRELDLNEGPTCLARGGRTFILYSARESRLPDYRMGRLELQKLAHQRVNALDRAFP